MAYNGILDTELDPDAPITSYLGYRLRDNPIAVWEGQTGAPRISGKAFQADITVGGTTRANYPSVTTDSEWYIPVLTRRFSETGEVRLVLDQETTRTSGSGSVTCDIRVRKNNSTIVTWSDTVTTDTTTVTARSRDITVVYGDMIDVFVRMSSGATGDYVKADNVELRTNGEYFNPVQLDPYVEIEP